MAYRECELGLLLRLNPNQAATRILSAYKRAKGKQKKAAELLGVGETTIKRWLRVLDGQGFPVREDIEAIRAERRAA